jgi:hypothetical protein
MSLFPYVASAQQNDVCTDGEGNPVICNPLQAENITQLLTTVVDVIVTLSIPIIAFAIIYAGFLFVTAGGNEDQLETAKDTAMYTIIGAGIILGSELIITILENTVSEFGVGE